MLDDPNDLLMWSPENKWGISGCSLLQVGPKYPRSISSASEMAFRKFLICQLFLSRPVFSTIVKISLKSLATSQGRVDEK